MSTKTKPAPFAHLTDQAICDVFTDVFQRDVTGWATSDLREDLAAMQAAPDLLAALKDCLAICLSRGEALGLDDGGPVLDKARAAIAKATRQP